MMLADARAILAELEQDLQEPSALSTSELTSPLREKVSLTSAVLLDDSERVEGGHPAASGSNGTALHIHRAPSAEQEAKEAHDSGSQKVVSFYRRKCLELASQVHRRDTEMVRLRQALNEARTATR